MEDKNKTVSTDTKKMIAFIYNHRKDKEVIRSCFRNPEAKKRIDTNVLSAISVEFKVSYAMIAEICREQGVITSKRQNRHYGKIETQSSWFTPITAPDFKRLTDEFLASKYPMIQVDVTASEFAGLSPEKIYEGFKHKHKIKVELRKNHLILTRRNGY